MTFQTGSQPLRYEMRLILEKTVRHNLTHFFNKTFVEPSQK